MLGQGPPALAVAARASLAGRVSRPDSPAPTIPGRRVGSVPPEPAPGDVGRRVRARRVDRKLSQDDLARAAGMAPTYLRYLEENPRAVPSSSAVTRLASALSTSVELLHGTGAGAPGASAAHVGGTPVLEVLDEATCQRLVRDGGVARVVFVDSAGPVALPVNVVMAGEDIVFQTSAGSVCAAVAAGDPISIEVDHFDPVLAEGWSVVLRGDAMVEDPGVSEAVVVESWAGAPRTTTIRLRPDLLTGRRVSRPR